jgi:3-methyladenine DNA glycosylase AlkD
MKIDQVRPIQEEILSHKNSKQAEFLSRFFKTGKGEYAEGDTFLGIRVPISRKISKKYKDIELSELSSLLHSVYHEMRLITLIILADQFKKGDDTKQKKIFELYCKNTKFINNWDLVDESAPKIPGCYLLDKDRSILYSWVRSKSLWERRIAIMSTFAFIRKGDYTDTLRIAEILVYDSEDLIHKATGWMLREIYKRDSRAASLFLGSYASIMPRTMLRYAIEHHPEKERKKILKQ